MVNRLFKYMLGAGYGAAAVIAFGSVLDELREKPLPRRLLAATVYGIFWLPLILLFSIEYNLNKRGQHSTRIKNFFDGMEELLLGGDGQHFD